MLVLLSAVAFFLLVTGLILIHELGHFLAAKKAGVVVEEFGFGLPPKAVTLFRWRGTAFTLNWIPFGGFVRLKGENAIESKERMEKGSFAKASILARCGILVAGVAMNFVLAFLIFLFGFSYGRWIPTYLTLSEMEAASSRGEIELKLGVLIDDVLAGGGAADAGIAQRTLLLAVDKKPVGRADEVLPLQASKTQVTYTVQTENEEPRDVSVVVEDGKTGVYLSTVPTVLAAPQRGIGASISLSVRETKVVTAQTILGIVKLVKSLAQFGTVPEGVTGIVGIAQLTYVSVQQGFIVYLRLVALLSLSLAILNILPFPALDGGRLVFVLKEAFFGVTSRRVEAYTNMVGLVVLLGLILVVTFFDVFRLIF